MVFTGCGQKGVEGLRRGYVLWYLHGFRRNFHGHATVLVLQSSEFRVPFHDLTHLRQIVSVYFLDDPKPQGIVVLRQRDKGFVRSHI